MALLESFSFTDFGVDGAGESSNSLALLGKFLSSKPPSRHTILAVLKRAWESFEGWTMAELEKGIFQFSFKLTKDRDSALARRPWTIRGALLLLECWPDHLQLEEISFSSCPVWIRLSGLPPALLADTPLSRIARLFGEVPERRATKEVKPSAFARFRAVINTSQALKPGFFLDRPNLNPIWIQAQYENIGTCCFRCGLLGHGAGECREVLEVLVSKEGFPEVPLYGEWLVAGSAVATCFSNGGRPRSSTTHTPSSDQVPTVDPSPKDRTLSSDQSYRGSLVSEPSSAKGVGCASDTSSFAHTRNPKGKGNLILSSPSDSSDTGIADLASLTEGPLRASKPRPKRTKHPGSSGIRPHAPPYPEGPPPEHPPPFSRGTSSLADKVILTPGEPALLELPPCDDPRGGASSTTLVPSAPRRAPSPGDLATPSPRVARPPSDKALSAPSRAPSSGSTRGILVATRGIPLLEYKMGSATSPPRNMTSPSPSSPNPGPSPRSSGKGKRRRTDDPRSTPRNSPILTRSFSRIEEARIKLQPLISAARDDRAVRTP